MGGALEGKRVVLGICGGIAAYKAVEVLRKLMDAGAHVVPVMTNAAHRFVGPTTFSALASEPVQSSLWDEASPIPHTLLGQSADVIVVAPATARLLGSYANGISNDLLTATLLATRAPVVVCPAMHTEMWEHPAVQQNVSVLLSRDVHVVQPDAGRLAGGDSGVGRLASADTIVAAVEQAVVPGDMSGLRVIVTAGGTREAIDAVRVISNRSTGKQGYALAAEARARSARVTLVSTVDRPTPPGVELVSVESAADMQQVVVPLAESADVVVMAAAVADFRPVRVVDRKIKKADGIESIPLEATHDFLVDLGQHKPAGQTLVGFAAETEDLESNALGKLKAKSLDLIVANDVSMDGAGFAYDTNEVVILGHGSRRFVPLTNKRAIAKAVFDAVLDLRNGARPGRSDPDHHDDATGEAHRQ